MRLLLTRPEPEAHRTAAALRAGGHDVIVAPLMRIEIIADAPIGVGPWEAIVITSANTAHAIAAHRQRAALYGIPVFAVGERSAEAMRAAGFSQVTAGEGGVEELARLVVSRVKIRGALLYLAAEDRSGDLAGDLGRRNLTVHTVVVYRAVAEARLPQAAAAALAAGLDGVLHYSRRSAEAYVDAARQAGLLGAALEAPHFCLSVRIAEPLRRAGAGTVHIAPRPMEAALLALVGAKPD